MSDTPADTAKGSPAGSRMPAMGRHTREEAVTRAHRAAWLVFVSMAGTTMAFQVYHSWVHGHMPPPLAVLYGVVPLFISMCVIEFVSAWDDAPSWARPAAYLIIGGAMFLSASATGAVVLRAAPPHMSLLFGLLLDGAAILAARFIMTVGRVASAPASEPLPVAPMASAQAAPLARSGGTPQAIWEASPQATGEAAREPSGTPPDEPLNEPASQPSVKPARKPARAPARAPHAPSISIPMDAESKRARRLYRESVEADAPLTDRKLAEKFPGRGRTWAGNRIAECDDGLQLASGASS